MFSYVCVTFQMNMVNKWINVNLELLEAKHSWCLWHLQLQAHGGWVILSKTGALAWFLPG